MSVTDKKTVALIFDFDDTLAPDSTSIFLQSCGIDTEKFWQETAGLIQGGWDPVPAYINLMVQYARNGYELTEDNLKKTGRNLNAFPGIPEAFIKLKEFADGNLENIELEFYLISSGLGTLLRELPFAGLFSGIFSCELSFDNNGLVSFPRRIVSFTEKTRYMYVISKGLTDAQYEGDPFAVNHRHDDFRIPFNRMLYIGDGFTDVPCFAILNQFKGLALGVHHPHQEQARAKAWKIVEERRVASMTPADYTEDSMLMNTIRQRLAEINQNIDQD